MRTLFIIILLITSYKLSYGQTFLKAYQEFRTENAKSISNLKERGMLQKSFRRHIAEPDTIFSSYKSQTGFDFNTADTLFIIYEAPADSPFANDVIIWSGNDTISYREGFEKIRSNIKRTTTYVPFVAPVYGIVTERDTLIRLVAKRDYQTIEHLGDDHSILDGGIVRIYVAYKDKGNYKFESCFPKKFIILDTYRKK